MWDNYWRSGVIVGQVTRKSKKVEMTTVLLVKIGTSSFFVVVVTSG